jgi:hypothetical protein
MLNQSHSSAMRLNRTDCLILLSSHDHQTLKLKIIRTTWMPALRNLTPCLCSDSAETGIRQVDVPDDDAGSDEESDEEDSEIDENAEICSLESLDFDHEVEIDSDQEENNWLRQTFSSSDGVHSHDGRA